MDNQTVVIYNDHAHVRLRLDRGRHTLAIPEAVRMSTICAYDSNLEPLTWNYIDGRINVTKIKNVVASIDKNGIEYNGVIIDISDTKAIIKREDGTIMTINNYDTVTITDIFTGNQEIVIDVEDNAIVSYIIDKVRWECVGTVLIDTEKEELYWRLAGMITNESDSSLNGMCYLLSGDVANRDYSPKMMTRSLAFASESNSNGGLVEDNVSYDVGYRQIANKDMAEIGSYNLAAKKMYIYDIGDDSTKYGYVFVAEEYIPACNITVYTTSGDQIGPHVGTDRVAETRSGKEVKILLGTTTKVQGKTIQNINRQKITEKEIAQYNLQRYSEVEYYITTNSIDLELKNYNDTVSTVRVQYYIGYAQLLDCTLVPYSRNSQEYIEWNIELPPGSEFEPAIANFKGVIVVGGM